MAHHSQHIEHHEKTTDEQIVWEIKPHDHIERSDKFYFIIFSAIVVLLLFSIWQNNFLFGIFVIMAGGTIIFLSSQKPQDYKFKLTQDALMVGEGDEIYYYSGLSHFDIYRYSPEHQELFIVFKKRIRPNLSIRIHPRDVEKIKDFLSDKIPQKKVEPSIFDIFSKIIGI